MGEGPVVFVSYSREDAAWRDKFEVMLKPVVRQRRLDVWSDERIVVGYEWGPQLQQAIARSRAAMLLISPDFPASDFHHGTGTPSADRARSFAGPGARAGVLVGGSRGA